MQRGPYTKLTNPPLKSTTQFFSRDPDVSASASDGTCTLPGTPWYDDVENCPARTSGLLSPVVVVRFMLSTAAADDVGLVAGCNILFWLLGTVVLLKGEA